MFCGAGPPPEGNRHVSDEERDKDFCAMHLSLHLDFTLWNFIVGAPPYQFLGIMPIALNHKAAALFIAPNQKQLLLS